MKNIFYRLVIILFSTSYAMAQTTFDGALRLGVSYHDSNTMQIERAVALGGYLGVTHHYNDNLIFSAKIHSSNALMNQQNSGAIPFFDSDGHSFALLSEANVQIDYHDSSLILGRQQIDTPFADSDDIAIVPNRFEAYTIHNTAIADTLLFYSYLRSMAGVDAENPSSFSKLNGGAGVHVLGVEYALQARVTFSLWYYLLTTKGDLSYGEIDYHDSVGSYEYHLAIQIANQRHKEREDAMIYGLKGIFTST